MKPKKSPSKEQTEKVKVLSAYVDGDSVMWLVQRPGDKYYPMVWPVKDFGKAWGFKNVLPVPQIEEFCQMMLGKEFNLVFANQPNNV